MATTAHSTAPNKRILVLMRIKMFLKRSRAVGGALRSIIGSNGLTQVEFQMPRRAFATSASDDGALPLRGFKVLDMTRVLAGVRLCDLLARVHVDHS